MAEYVGTKDGPHPFDEGLEQTATPEPAAAPEEPAPSSSNNTFLIAGSVTGVAAVIAWIVTFLQALSFHSDLDDIANNPFLDASAIQISQVADQSQLELAQFTTLSLGLTALFVVVAGLGILRR